MTTRRTIVLWAFICHPEFGSEGGLGWNWSQALARRGHDVHLVTSPAHRSAIEQHLLKPSTANVTVHFTKANDKVFARGQRGHIGFYFDYMFWQQQALHKTRRLGLDSADVKHHVSFGAMLPGSRLADLGPPFVFGPAGGGHLSGPELRRLLERSMLRDAVRTVMIKHLAPFLPTIRRTVPRTDLTLAANESTFELARRLGARRVERMVPDGIDASVLTPSPRSTQPSSGQVVLWVGRFLPHRAPFLAVDAFKHVRLRVPTAQLVMVGDGPKLEQTRRHAAELGLNGVVEFTGNLDWPNVFRRYDEADVFLYTSIRDTASAQALEAAARGLPCIALSHSGGGGCDHLPDAGATKVTAMPTASIGSRLGNAVAEVLVDTAGYEERSAAMLAFAADNTWDTKASKMSNWYAEL